MVNIHVPYRIKSSRRLISYRNEWSYRAYRILVEILDLVHGANSHRYDSYWHEILRLYLVYKHRATIGNRG